LKSVRLISASESLSWPTPVASEVRDQGTNWASLARKDKGGRILRRIASLAMTSGQQGHCKTNLIGKCHERLNPRWVEQLMGVPIGWTSCDCLETESSQQPLTLPSQPCSQG
jgi:hypothetical protein